MAMEINSKNLHKHAVPLVMLSAVIITVTAVSLAQYQSSIPRGLEALLGQKYQAETPQKLDMHGLGSTVLWDIKSD